jgi:ADP-ribose pyrophosphatase
MAVEPWKRIEPTVVAKVDYHNVVVKTFEVPGTGKALTIATTPLEGSRAGHVIAITKDKKVVVARQFRHGPEKMMDEIPGGIIDEGEEPDAGTRRELLEETGYKAGTMEFLGTSSRDGYNNRTWYYYLAVDCELSKEGLHQDEYEQIEVKLISIEQLIHNAKHDNMIDVAAVLMAYEQLKELSAT